MHIEAAIFVIIICLNLTPKQIIIFHIECVVGFIKKLALNVAEMNMLEMYYISLC